MPTKYSELAEQIREEIDDLQGNKVSDYSLRNKVNKVLGLIGNRLVELKAPIVTKRMKLNSFYGSADLPDDFQNLVKVTDETAENEGAPGRIANLRYTINSSNQITLAWDSDITATGYRVYDDTLVLLAETATNIFTIDITVGNIYGFYVTGINENGEGELSDLLTVDLTLGYFKYIEQFDGMLTNCFVDNGVLKPTFTTYESLEKMSETLLATSNTLQTTPNITKGYFLHSVENKLYYSLYGVLHEIDIQTKQIIKTANLYGYQTDKRISKIVWIGNILYCICTYNTNIAKVNKTTFTSEGSFNFGCNIFTIETDGNYLFVGCQRNGEYQILKLNATDGSILDILFTAPYEYQGECAAIYDNGKLYVTYGLGDAYTRNIAKIDVVTRTVEKTLNFASNQIGNHCITQIGDYIYLTNAYGLNYTVDLHKIRKSDLTIELSKDIAEIGEFPLYLTADGTYIYLNTNSRKLFKLYAASLNEVRNCNNFVATSIMDVTNCIALNKKIYIVSTASTGDILYEIGTVGYNYSLSGKYESNLIDLTIAGTAIRSVMNFTKNENGTSTVKVFIQYTFDSGQTFTPYYECFTASELPFITNQKLNNVCARLKVEFISDAATFAQIENIFFEINQ